jgi:hypothetical protein
MSKSFGLIALVMMLVAGCGSEKIDLMDPAKSQVSSIKDSPPAPSAPTAVRPSGPTAFINDGEFSYSPKKFGELSLSGYCERVTIVNNDSVPHVFVQEFVHISEPHTPEATANFPRFTIPPNGSVTVYGPPSGDEYSSRTFGYLEDIGQASKFPDDNYYHPHAGAMISGGRAGYGGDAC